MDLQLQDKVIIVTGGASGIGEAIVRQLSEEGAVPVILDRDRDRGDRLGAECAGVRFIELDLTDSAAISDALNGLDTLDGIVNNAGFNDGVGLDGTLAEFQQSLGRNLNHCFQVVSGARQKLIRSRSGSIVNVGSKVAVTGQGGTSGYAAAKGALNALTREWAVDFASHGVRVNSVLPAEVWTPMYENWISGFEDAESRKLRIESRIPLSQRMTTPQEIADMVVFLLSPRSSHTTGQIIHVDGGYTHLDRAIACE